MYYSVFCVFDLWLTHCVVNVQYHELPLHCICCVYEEEPRQWLKPELQVRRGDRGSVGRFKGGACVMCEFNSSRVIAYECNRLSVVGLAV
jgi:hypothetical protein